MPSSSRRPEPQRDGADLGGRGGTGTFRGTDYQLRVALHRALELIERQLLAPHAEFAITLEPLILETGGTEKWDIGTEPPQVVMEAKLRPGAKDIREFLSAARSSRAEHIELIYGEKAGRLHAALEQLRLLHGTAADPERFARFVAEAGEAVRDVAGLLGDRAHDVVGRLRLHNLPDGLLNRELEHRAAALAGDRGEELLELLLRRFSAGAGERRRFRVDELLQLLARRDIALHLPLRATAGLSPSARSSLLVLQRVGAAVPGGVLARAIGVRDADLSRELADLAPDGLLREEHGSWRLRELPARVAGPRERELLATTLRELLLWIDDHPAAPALDAAVDAAVALTRLVADPEVVAPAFRTLDKLLKRRGDKQIVLEIANRCIGAAGAAATRSDAIVEAEAVALICGRSWVYQRIGQLAKARADGEHSLQIGEQIGWDRNTAFCHKCLGRLCRLEAEEQLEPRRSELLAASAHHLERAVRYFTELGLEPEVGDAWSLLARTRLVMGDLPAARAALAEAERRLIEPADKDFVDMLIVRGDIAVAGGSPADALASYTAAVDAAVGGSEHSEMRARAHHQRALAHLALRRRDEARADFAAAARTYASLKEPHFAALSELEVMRVEGRLPLRAREPDVARLLELERPLVQVEALRAHERAVAAHARDRAPLAFRKDATVEHWRTMIREGRRQAAKADRPW